MLSHLRGAVVEWWRKDLIIFTSRVEIPLWEAGTDPLDEAI
jgi:hypothetical protein